jgi:hypothetical protein
MHDGNVSRGEQEDGAGAAVRWQAGDPEVAPPAECEPGSPEVQLLAPPGDGTVTFFAFPSGGGLALVSGNPPLFQQPEIGGVRGKEEPEDDPVFFRSHIVASGADISARKAVEDAPRDANADGWSTGGSTQGLICNGPDVLFSGLPAVV